MKFNNQWFSAVLLLAMTALYGCSYVLNGAKDVQAAVEFAKYDQQVLVLATENQRKIAADSPAEIQQSAQQLREKLLLLQESFEKENNSSLAKTMVKYTTELMVSTIDHNNQLDQLLYPLKMTMEQRIEQLKDEPTYQHHVQALKVLKQDVMDLESVLDKIKIDVLQKAKQAGLSDILMGKMNEYFVTFCDANKKTVLPSVAHLPKLVDEELQWFDYLYQKKAVISVSEKGQLLFATQQDLDDYNSKFGNSQ